MANDRTSNYNAAGISREALADVALTCATSEPHGNDPLVSSVAHCL